MGLFIEGLEEKRFLSFDLFCKVDFCGHAAEEGWVVVAVFISTLKSMSGEFELMNFYPGCKNRIQFH